MLQTGRTTAREIFEIEQDDDTIIIAPAVDLRQLDFQRIEEGARKFLDLLIGSKINNVVLDFHKTDYCGSSAISFLLKLLNRVRRQNGRMALCNVSDHLKGILQMTKLDDLWPICSSTSEALEVVRTERIRAKAPIRMGARHERSESTYNCKPS